MQPQQQQFPFKRYLEIKSVTWTKDSHGLFDYESKNLVVKKTEVNDTCQIFRDESESKQNQMADIRVNYANQALNQNQFDINQKDLKYLASIQVTKSEDCGTKQFSLVPEQISPTASDSELNTNTAIEETFLIVRSIKNKEGVAQGIVLIPGTVLKLGRIEYLVQEYKDFNMKTQYNDNSNAFCDVYQYIFQSKLNSKVLVPKFSQPNQQTQTDQVSSNENQNKNCTFEQQQQNELISLERKSQSSICRICLDSKIGDEIDEDYDNLSEKQKMYYGYLLAPCRCKGTQSFVHFKCLKNWLNWKTQKKEQNNAVYYSWKKLECEVCKSPMPKSVCIDDESIDLINIQRPQCPYLMLESVSRDKKISRGLYCIKMQLLENQIKMGRGHQSDLRISDISVSRLHAVIRYVDNKFRVFDNNSKFGTLVLARQPMMVQNEKLAVQIGRTVISLMLKNTVTEQRNKQMKMVQNNLKLKKTGMFENNKEPVINGNANANLTSLPAMQKITLYDENQLTSQLKLSPPPPRQQQQYPNNVQIQQLLDNQQQANLFHKHFQQQVQLIDQQQPNQINQNQENMSPDLLPINQLLIESQPNSDQDQQFNFLNENIAQNNQNSHNAQQIDSGSGSGKNQQANGDSDKMEAEDDNSDQEVLR